MEAWRTCGTWMMVTFCVTRSWCRLSCRNLTSPSPKSEWSRTSRTELTNKVNGLDAAPPACEDMDFSPRRSRLSAPQVQAELSRLTDRTRPRRLKSTLLSKEAWQQVTRVEDLCHTHVPNKWHYHLDACAGSVSTPHDYTTNVQKRLGNRA